MMSLEKAIIFQKYPELIIQYIKEKYNYKEITVSHIYYERNDRNLKMKWVVLFIEYSLNG